MTNDPDKLYRSGQITLVIANNISQCNL